MPLALRISMIIAMGLAAAACAPKKTERVYKDTTITIQPKNSDTVLDFSSIKPNSLKLKIPNVLSSTDVFNLAEAAITLGEGAANPIAHHFGLDVIDSFLSNPRNTTFLNFTESPYLLAAIGESKDTVKTEIHNGYLLLDTSALILKARLTTDTYPWPEKPTALRQAVVLLKDYLAGFQNWLGISELEPVIREAILAEIAVNLDTMDKKLPQHLDALDKADTLAGLLAPVKAAMIDLGFKLSDKQDKFFRWGTEINERLLTTKSPEDALSLLVFIWRGLDEKTRPVAFAKNLDLHEWLSKQSPRRLDCLVTNICLDPYLEIAKIFKILPAIRKYKVENLLKDVNTGTFQGGLEELKFQVHLMLKDLPNIILAKINENFHDQRLILTRIENDFPGFVNKAAAKWASQNLGSNARLRGAEVPRVRLKMLPGGLVVENADALPTKEIESSTLGASWAALVSYWNAKDSDQSLSPTELSRSILEQINKLLAVGGFHLPNNELFASFATNIDGQNVGTMRMNLRTATSDKETFAVPDKIQLKSGLNKEEKVSDIVISADSQAEILRGLSKMIYFLRDWEINSYNKTLGKVMVSDLDFEIPTRGIRQKMFPKDTMFTLSVANAAVLLTNIMKDVSPVFMMNSDNRLIWANDFAKVKFDNTTMAGVVDIVNGKRQDIVNTKSVARFVLALAEFVRSTEGIENTTSSILQEKGPNGKSSVDQIKEARIQLRLLMLGLANYIARQVMAPDGGVYSHYSWPLRTAVTSETRDLVVQAWAIRALVSAGELLNMDLFKVAAIDVLFFMNKSMFKESLAFYTANESQTILPEIVDMGITLTAMTEVRKYLGDDSRRQVNTLVRNWLAPLKGVVQ